jgi:putative phosphoesterase
LAFHEPCRLRDDAVLGTDRHSTTQACSLIAVHRTHADTATATVADMRIGLLADTHIPEAGPDLPRTAYDALASCDRIIHAGDLHVIEVLDRLERVAPVISCRGNGDIAPGWGSRPGVPEDPRVADVLVLDVAGLAIGVVHDIEHYDSDGEERLTARLDQTFGRRVDAVVCGHTHVPMTWGLRDGPTIVNPGSPTMPYGYLRLDGTVGFLDIGERGFEVSVLDLLTGEDQLRLRGGIAAPRAVGPRPAI